LRFFGKGEDVGCFECVILGRVEGLFQSFLGLAAAWLSVGLGKTVELNSYPQADFSYCECIDQRVGSLSPHEERFYV
jgi:hypothetical protein